MVPHIALFNPPAACLCDQRMGGLATDIPKPNDPLKPAPPPPALEASVVNLSPASGRGWPSPWMRASLLSLRVRKTGMMRAPLELDDVRFLYRLVRGSFRYRMNHDHFDVWFDHRALSGYGRERAGGEFVEGVAAMAKIRRND